MIRRPLVVGNNGRTQQIQRPDELDNSRYSYEQQRERLFRKLLLSCAMNGVEFDDPELQEELSQAVAENA